MFAFANHLALNGMFTLGRSAWDVIYRKESFWVTRQPAGEAMATTNGMLRLADDTPLARDELSGPRGEGYRRMINVSAAGRAGTPDEVGTVGALLMGPDGAFITGSDFLMDGGVTAAYWFGELAPK